MSDDAQRPSPTPPTPETYDDRPQAAAGLPPEIVSPLAPFAGAEPPAPAWFAAAIAEAPERRLIGAPGRRIELLTWGEVGKPGLLLVHGNSAHADWWSFIAPFLAKDYRVASMSLAGMGGSDWRDRYASADFADDARACVSAAGLDADGRPPVYIGHSFGGVQVFMAAVRHPEHMRGAVLIDTGAAPPPRADGRPAPFGGGGRVYATEAEALARFRLMPPQPAENLYIVDYIARRSLRRAPMPDGSGEGWTWRFDPNTWSKIDRDELAANVRDRRRPETPLVHVFGEHSMIVARLTAGEPSFLPRGIPWIEIPDSHHHVMIDQPLALVSALRALLAVWPA